MKIEKTSAMIAHRVSLTIDRALVSDGSGSIAVSDVTATELSYLDGVTSAIQTQIDGKEPAIAGTANYLMKYQSDGTGHTPSNIYESGGNVGIGKSTLEAWDSSKTVLQIGGNSSIYGTTNEQVGASFVIMSNAYYDGSDWKRVSTDETCQIVMTNGDIKFKTDASGTADATFTPTERMKIDSSGHVFLYSLSGTTGGSDLRYDTSTKEVFYDTSARKYKENIRENPDTSWVHDIPVVVYDRKDKSRNNEVGILADDLAAIRPDYCAYNEEGEVETYSKSDLVPLLLAEVQKLRKEVDELKNCHA